MMFRSTATATEPAPDGVAPAVDLVPVSHISLDLSEPGCGWVAYLNGRGVEVVTDDIGRPSIARADARQLFDEHRESEARKQAALARQELEAIERDKAWWSQLPVGLPWYEIPDGVPPSAAMLQAAKDDSPRRRSLTEDLLDRRDSMVFHPIHSTPDEE
jgi:hypothetical protein